MSSLAHQLIAARKARGMTQEQLAQAVHISRSRISRWETGDAVPDLNMIRLLSQVLEVDLLAAEPPQPSQEPAPQLPEQPAAPSPADHSPSEPTAAAPAHVSVAKKLRMPALLTAAAVLLLLLILVLRPQAPAPKQDLVPYTQAWYQQEIVPAEGQAHVQIMPAQNPTKAIRFEDFPNGVGWFYEFHFNSLNDIPFTVNKITHSVFNAHGADHQEFTGDMLLSAMQGDLVLAPNRPHHFAWCGGFPLQPVSAVGIVAEGVDANGHDLSFRGYVELSQEVAE